MKVALCQLRTSPGDIVKNTDTVLRTVSENEADLYVFPEMFLTDYMFRDFDDVRDSLGICLRKILDATSQKGCTVVVGGPRFSDGKVFNSAYVISDRVRRYDKINLPNFGPFSERSAFANGGEPLSFDACGFRFGVIVCYDIFFPELTKHYAMDGADAVICISASPSTSRTAFERVFPARSVESTVYMIFVNNVGTKDGMTFFGGSRCLSPAGDLIAQSEGGEEVSVVELSHEAIADARAKRPTLADTWWPDGF